ncbi:MAG TPA: DUF1572 domain-containing protein [Puia sp.]
MHLTKQIAKQFREVYFGGNWTAVSLRENLEGLSWQQATTRVYSFNTIAGLLVHMNYYIKEILKVVAGGTLEASDKFSFDHPPILSKEDWEKLLESIWSDAEKFAVTIEQLPEDKLWETFANGLYGNYYRNFQGVTEHVHYHLGQIVLINKILAEKTE